MKQDLYLLTLRSWQRLPPILRQAIKASWAGWVVKLARPQDDTKQVWRLSGALTGHKIKIGHPEDFQFVDHAYEPEVCAVIAKLVRPGWVCADIGAHVGYMTLLMAKLVGDMGTVVAFEAAPDNVQLLAENIALNGYSHRVQVVQCAVSDGLQDFVSLYRGPSSFETSITAGPRQDARIEVPATSLDRFFAPDARLDFVKMDIEGAEVAAVSGMKRILARQRPIMLVEIHGTGTQV